MNWPKESWVLLLRSVLVGKAQEIYGLLSVEQSSDYEYVKEAILKACKLVPEAYRQKFRNYLKYDSKTYVEFVREKENLFNIWCHSKEVGHDFKKLKQWFYLKSSMIKSTLILDLFLSIRPVTFYMLILYVLFYV